MIVGRKIWVASLILSILGLADSVYLSWIKFSHTEASCIRGIGDCFSVNTSRYSEFMGIPIALFGVIGYLIIIVVLLAGRRPGFFLENSPLIVFGATLFGVLYSAYLTYLEIAVIKAICPYCLVSAILMLSLFILSIVQLTASYSQSNPLQEE